MQADDFFFYTAMGKKIRARINAECVKKRDIKLTT